MVMVVNTTEPAEIIRAVLVGEITREAAIGALVQGGHRTVRGADALVRLAERLTVKERSGRGFRQAVC